MKTDMVQITKVKNGFLLHYFNNNHNETNAYEIEIADSLETALKKAELKFKNE